ncbi:MAG: KilA-N protein [Rhizobium sp.]|nr:KilA-N protein [Rhizobium sp.]
MPEMKMMLFKSTRIRVDENGLVCLNDIRKAAGFSKNQTPADWMALPSTWKEVSAMLTRNTGKSGVWTKEQIKSVYYSKQGNAGGTWAVENLALGYASYLSPALAVEIREIFLRFKAGDESLIAEIKANKAKRDTALDMHREIGKQIRRGYTDTLKERGLTKGFEYAVCTNETYKPLLGGTAKELKVSRSLHPKANLRDHMPLHELAYTMASEALAVERIEHQDANGFPALKTETRLAAQSIHSAIEGDRKNRQKKLV